MSQQPSPPPQGVAIIYILRAILLLWFLTISAVLFYTTWTVLPFITQPVAISQQPPLPPPQVMLDQINPSWDSARIAQAMETNRIKVEAYKQQVSAHSQAVDAYKASLDAVVKSPRLTAYETIVKDTLSGFFNTFITAFLALVFANASLAIGLNFVRMRRGDAWEPVRLI